PVDNGVGIMFTQGVANLGISLDVTALSRTFSQNLGTTHAGTTLVGSTLEQLDASCPHTGFRGYTLPNGSQVDIYLPKMNVFRKETLLDLTPNGFTNP